MRALLRRTIPVLAATAVAVLAFVAVGSADGHVSVVEGNPSCTDLGYDFGYKIDMESFDGTYPIVVGGFDTGETVTASSDGTYVDWSSTLGMDAVKVKGGPNANLYTYDPESFGDTGLTAPNNVDSGGLYGVSHVEFCFDFELEVSKTANTSWERAYDWDLDKSVDDDGHIGWAGDSFTSNYDVDVSLEVTDQNWAIHGSIEIHNPSPFDVPFMVVDEIDGGVGPADVSCLTDTVPKGNTVTCTYTASPGGQYGTLNTATVTSYNPLVQGGEGTAPVIWGDPVVVGYDEVTVTDTLEGTLGTIGESTLFEYPKDFVCPTDPTMYTSGVYTTTVDNTAKITETGDEDSESVSLTCYLPTVTKTARRRSTGTGRGRSTRRAARSSCSSRTARSTPSTTR